MAYNGIFFIQKDENRHPEFHHIRFNHGDSVNDPEQFDDVEAYWIVGRNGNHVKDARFTDYFMDIIVETLAMGYDRSLLYNYFSADEHFEESCVLSYILQPHFHISVNKNKDKIILQTREGVMGVGDDALGSLVELARNLSYISKKGPVLSAVLSAGSLQKAEIEQYELETELAS